MLAAARVACLMPLIGMATCFARYLASLCAGIAAARHGLIAAAHRRGVTSWRRKTGRKKAARRRGIAVANMANIILQQHDIAIACLVARKPAATAAINNAAALVPWRCIGAGIISASLSPAVRHAPHSAGIAIIFIVAL